MKGSERQELNLFWLGAVLAVLYWPLEAAIHVFLFQQGALIEQLLHPGPNEFWMRLVISLLMVTFGAVGEKMMRRQRQFQKHAERLNRLLSFLSEVNQVMSRQRDPQALFEAACRIASDKGGFHSAWIGLLNEETGLLEPKAYVDLDEDALKRFSISKKKECPGCEIISNAIRHGEHFVCNEIAMNSCKSFCRSELMRHGVHAAASFPLHQHEKIIGAFTVYSTDPNYFETDELDVLVEATGDISFALEAIKREESLRNRLDELEHFQKTTVQREFRIKELRDEIKQLRQKLNDVSPEDGA